MILTRNLCLNRINNVNFSIQKTIFCRFLDKLNSHLIDNMIFGFSMVELVRINVSFVPKLKKIFSTLTPSSGQTISSIGLSNISLESVLHKLSFGIKISRLPVDPKPYGKKTDFFFYCKNYSSMKKTIFRKLSFNTNINLRLTSIPKRKRNSLFVKF
jgi:hypothetical protein